LNVASVAFSQLTPTADILAFASESVFCLPEIEQGKDNNRHIRKVGIPLM
jgi:hypothetical protein